MVNRIILKKSTVAAKAPAAGDLQIGEVAVNTADAVIYTKHSDGSVKLVGVAPNDARLSDSREWSASTVTQAAAEAGTDTARSAWTALRVRQAALGWWAGGNAYGSTLATASTKSTLIDTDKFGISDSADANKIKSYTYDNLKNNLRASFVSGSYSGTTATIGDASTTTVTTVGKLQAAGSYTATSDTKPNLHIDNLGNITRVEKEETNLYDISTHLVSGVYNLTLADRDRILYCEGGLPFEVVVPDALPDGFTFYAFTVVSDCFVTTTSPEYFVGAGALEIQATLLVEPYCVNVYKNFGSSLGGMWYSYTQNSSTNRHFNYSYPTYDPLVDDDIFLVKIGGPTTISEARATTFGEMKSGMEGTFAKGSNSGTTTTIGTATTDIVTTTGQLVAEGSYTNTADLRANLAIDALGNIKRITKESFALKDISASVVLNAYEVQPEDRDAILVGPFGDSVDYTLPATLPDGFSVSFFSFASGTVTPVNVSEIVLEAGVQLAESGRLEPYTIKTFLKVANEPDSIWYGYALGSSPANSVHYSYETTTLDSADYISATDVDGLSRNKITFADIKTQLATTFVTGPASATNNAVAVFDGVTGKLLKSGGGVLAGGSVTGSTIVGGTMSGVTATSCTINDSIMGGSYRIGSTDTRYAYPVPYDGTLVDYGMRLEFKTLNYLTNAVKDATGITPNVPAPSGTYLNTLTVTPWGDPSGGYPMQLGFDTTNARLFLRSGASYGGMVDRPTVASWITGKTVALNATIHPTSANRRYFYFKCTTAGTTGATEPTWPVTNAGTVTDGTAVWTAMPYWTKWRTLPTVSYTDTTTAIPNMVIDATGNLLRSTAVVGAGTTAALARTAIGMDACGPITFTSQAPPVAPAATGVALFGKAVAGRNLPAYRGNTGLDSILQSSIVRNKLSRWLPIGNSVTVDTDGVGDLTATGVATLATVATTNRHTWQKRIDYLVTTAASTAVAGWSYTETMWGRGANAGDGGFFMVCRFGLATGNTTATRRCFVGLRNSVAAPTDVNPSTQVNCVGVGYDSADTQLQIIYNDASGTASKIALGSSFNRPTTDRTSCYELALYCAPAGTSIGYEVTDLVSGAVATGSITTDMPANTTLLAPIGYASVGGTSSVIGITLMSLGIETDY